MPVASRNRSSATGISLRTSRVSTATSPSPRSSTTVIRTMRSSCARPTRSRAEHSIWPLVTASESMVESIVSYGVGIGCIYALIGITYNVMFSASRVFSFTAGILGMLGGVLGSLFIARLGLPLAVGFLLALAGGVVLGLVTEIVAVRPVLENLHQHLYVLSTLGLALMVQQVTSI